MNTKMKYATNGALTVGLLALCSVSTAGIVSHTAINDAFDAAYDRGGIIIMSDASDFTTLTTLEIDYNPDKICNVFGEIVDVIIFTKPDHSVIHIECTL